jgi:CubicO group peptidase (beta-lactamase class C family)
MTFPDCCQKTLLITSMNRLFLFTLAFCPALLFGQTNSPDAKSILEFDRYVEDARKEWLVPGLTIAVIKDNQVIFKKGYGYTGIGTGDPVDTKTLFPCASTTKAMTAVCLGMLVDEGKVKWSDPVVNYLPDFQLYDPFVTREVKIRDLLIHDSGLGDADFLWTSMNIPSDEIIRKMSLVKPSYSIRSSFIYQNLFYLVAGKVIEKVSGIPWDMFIRRRIFVPLSMTRTYPTRNDVNDPNQAKACMKVGGTLMMIEHSNADAIGPAGSVWSCIDDMSKWALCMLDSGKYTGGTLLKPATWKEMFKPQTIVPASEFYPTMQLIKPNWTTYGLGWFQHDYKGKKVNLHTGSLSGAIAIHAQMPEANMAMVVFGNLDHAEVRHALVYKTFDLFALGGNRDWSSEFLKLYKRIQENNEQKQKDFEAHRIPNTNPSLRLQDYTGKYADPLYGELEVTVGDKTLIATLNHIAKATLAHWNFDTFYGEYEKNWNGKVKAVFSINALGEIDRINFDGMGFAKTH